MAHYASRRLVQAIPTLFIAMAIVFFAIRLIPGDELTARIGEQVVGAEQRAALKKDLGLDKPLYVQYWDFATGLARGDLGTATFDKEPVRDKIWNRLPVTIELAVLSTIISILIAIPVGVISAVRRNSPLDYGLRVLALLALSIPTFWLATMILVGLAIWLGWVPSIQPTSIIHSPWANLKQFFLPSLLLGAVLAGSTMRITRSMMLDVLREDYVRTALAKGLSYRVVVIRHALRNCLIPIVTVIGLQVATLIGGTVIIESIFGLSGVGTLAIGALNSRDYPVVQGVNVAVVVTVLLVNIAVDLSYFALDPRLRHA